MPKIPQEYLSDVQEDTTKDMEVMLKVQHLEMRKCFAAMSVVLCWPKCLPIKF